jgi:hypothetical protein
MLSGGGVVIIYSPHDRRWLQEDPWLGAGAAVASDDA